MRKTSDSDFLVVLDACVLAPAPLRDTLLRLAEDPRLYLPRWSDDIVTEMVRTLEDRFGIAPHRTAYLVDELRKHFGDAWVKGYEPLIGSMSNDSKDRHVVAAAVRCGAEMIVTYNKRHFLLRLWNRGKSKFSAQAHFCATNTISIPPQSSISYTLKRETLAEPATTTESLTCGGSNLCRHCCSRPGNPDRRLNELLALSISGANWDSWALNLDCASSRFGFALRISHRH
jgi:predicted nucleic acid-binding protein